MEKCKIENCQIIYTEYQCKNCPNQTFDNCTTTTTQEGISWIQNI